MAEDYVWIPWDSILEHCEHVKPIRDVIPEFYVSLSPSSPQGGSWQLTEPTIDNTVYSLETSFSPKQDGTPWHSSETNMNPYLYRAEPSLGHTYNTEYLDSVVGGTVAWNQLVQNGDFATDSMWIANLGTRTIANNKLTYSSTTKSGSNSIYLNREYTPTAVVGHAYLALVTVTLSESSNDCAILWQKGKTGQLRLTPSVVNANQKTTIGRVFKCTDVQAEGELYFYPNIRYGLTVGETATLESYVLFDLTQLFGTTIADHIYSLEQATAGAGVAWFKALFPKAYYPYNAGELLSVQTGEHWTVGFNQWDEEWELGTISTSTGQNGSNNTLIRSTNYIPCVPNTQYYPKAPSGTGGNLFFYDADKNYISYVGMAVNLAFTTPSNARYMRFRMGSAYGTTYKNDICINLSWSGYRNGEYEPYIKRTYPLDTLTLRGIPKLDSSGNLYYDGDEYKPDGAVTRRYGVVDLGTLDWNREVVVSNGRFNAVVSNLAPIPSDSLAGYASGLVCDSYLADGHPITNNSVDKAIAKYSGRVYIRDDAYTSAADFKTAMSGVYLVYELATPTTETADPYQQIQICDDFGTEGFTDERTVPIPVGHETRYADVYPIVGWTEINVTVSPTQDAQDGYTTPVPLGQTVYGGTIDVVTGEMTLDMVVDTFDGDSVTSVSSANGVMFARVVASHLSSGVTSEFMCDSYIPSTQSQSGNIVWVSSSQQVVRIFNRGFKNLATAKAALDEQPVHLCYPLATPITVQIPPTEIELFLGQNNIWSDTGENVHIATADDEQTGMIVSVYGKTLWMRSHIFYKDGTDEYTTPIRIG